MYLSLDPWSATDKAALDAIEISMELITCGQPTGDALHDWRRLASTLDRHAQHLAAISDPTHRSMAAEAMSDIADCFPAYGEGLELRHPVAATEVRAARLWANRLMWAKETRKMASLTRSVDHTANQSGT
jgi:hypothetical protein